MRLHWTKTRQAASSCLELPLVRFPGSKLCPVMAIKQMFGMFRADLAGPAFVHKDSQSWTYSEYNKKLKSISDIGHNPKYFASHSVRRGGTTQFRVRVLDKLIKLMGDWKSDCYLDYLQF